MKHWCCVHLCSCCNVFMFRVCALHIVFDIVSGAIFLYLECQILGISTFSLGRPHLDINRYE